MFKSIFGGFRKTFLPKLPIKGILGIRELKDTTKLVKDIGKDTFKKEEATRKENFTEAVKRYQLTDAEIEQRQHSFGQIALIFFAIAILCFAYAIYLAFQGEIMAFLLGLGVTGLGLTYAFRYHFWAFQLKHKKLGCSLAEWWHSEVKTTQSRDVATTQKNVSKKTNK